MVRVFRGSKVTVPKRLREVFGLRMGLCSFGFGGGFEEGDEVGLGGRFTAVRRIWMRASKTNLHENRGENANV